MKKGKLIAGIIILVIGVGLIPANFGMNNLIERRMDESIITSMREIRDSLRPYTTAIAYAEGTPDVLLEIKSTIEPLIPELVNGSVSAEGLEDILNDLSTYIGEVNASEWFFNDPAWTTSTSGNYSIEGISEYNGLGNLSFSTEAQSAFLSRFSTGTGFYTIFNQLDRVPIEIGQFEEAGGANDVFVSGNYAYVANGTDGLGIVDITDPQNPSLITTFDTAGEAYGVVVSGNYAYVADGTNGIVILGNITDDTVYEIGNYNTPGTAYGVAVSGGYAYVADGTNGFEILDNITDSSIYEIGAFNTAGTAYGVAVSGGYAYVADGTNGLEIFTNITDSTVYEVGSFDTAGVAYDVAVSGGYAYVADGTNGLEILANITDSSVYEVGHLDTAGESNAVVISDGYAYVADGTNGLEIVDISDETNPFSVGQYSDGQTASGIAKNGNYAFIADGDDGLEIYDVTFPSQKYDLSTLYNSSLSQIKNVTNYIENHLFPNVPTLGNLPFEATTETAGQFVYMQWANTTIVPGFWEIEVFDEEYKYWEARVGTLTLAQAQELWDTSNSSSPLNAEGTQLWLESFSDSTIRANLQSIYNLSDFQYERLQLYFTDDDLLQDIVDPIYVELYNRTIRQLSFDKIYLQWSNGEIFPENVTFLNPLYKEFELSTAPGRAGIDPATCAQIWQASNLYSLWNLTGIHYWYDIARQDEGNYANSEYYSDIRDAFGLNDTQMEYIATWLLEFRPHSVDIVDELYGLDFHPEDDISMLYLLTTGVYIASGIIGFVGLMLVITSFRKERVLS